MKTLSFASLRNAMLLGVLFTTGVCGFYQAHAVTTNYFTGFELSDNFTNGFKVANSNNGWLGVRITTDNYAYYASSNGNGILSGQFPGMGQQAYVGKTALGTDGVAPFGFLYAWYTNSSFDPIAAGRPIVKFSTTMSIVDSSNGYSDDFSWEAYNAAGDHLFTLDFYNGDKEIYYVPSGGSSFVDTGRSFANGTLYNLVITMDYSNNVWSASLDGTQFLGPIPLAATGVALTFGDVDAVWNCYDNASTGHWGDNYMVFDNYLITSESATLPPPPSPSLAVLSAVPSASATLRLTGQEGYRFAILGSTTLQPGGWTPLTTNTVSGGYFDYTDTGASSLTSRFYRAQWVQ